MKKKNIKHFYYLLNSLLLTTVLLVGACSDGGVTGSEESNNISFTGTAYSPPATNTSGGQSFDVQSIIGKVENGQTGLPNETNSASTPDTSAAAASHQSTGGASLTDILEGEVPVAGAAVKVYDLDAYAADPQNTQPVAETSTNEEGEYTVSGISEGMNVLIIVNNDPRLSMMQYNVDSNTEADLNSATTLAAERWGPELNAVTEADFNETLNTVTDMLEASTADELAYLLNELVPGEFGNGFPEDLSPQLQTIVNLLKGIDLMACNNLELEVNSGKPADQITVSGLSEDFGEEPIALYHDAAIETPKDEDLYPIYIQRTENSQGSLVVPVHPNNLMDGGNIEILIMNEDQSLTCANIEIEVQPLESAPVTMTDIVDNMENALVQRAEALGFSRSELISANIENLPPYIAPVAAGLKGIGDPDFSNNLRNMLSGDAPMLDDGQMKDENRQVLEAVMYNSGYSDNITAYADKLAALPEVPSNIANKTLPDKSNLQSLDMDFGIETPYELNFWMDAQQRCVEANSGVAQGSRVAGGIVIAGAGAAVPGAQGVASVALLNLFLFETILNVCEGHFPSTLTGIELEAGPPTDFDEDDEIVAPWDATLSAEGNGYTFTWADALGAAPGIGKAGNMITSMARGGGPAGKFLGDMSERFLDFSQEFSSRLWSVDGPDSGPINWPVQEYSTGVDPNRTSPDEETFFNWELEIVESESGKKPFIFVNGDTHYEPNAVGQSDLRVETQGGDVFQGEVVSGTQRLKVAPIEVEIQDAATEAVADIFRVGPEDNYAIDLWADVQNADDKTVKWRLELEEGPDIASVIYSGAENRSAAFDGSSIQSAEGTRAVYNIEAESITEAGLRKGLDPTRNDVATIIVSEEEVELNVSEVVCIQQDDSKELTATVGGEAIPFSDMTWSVSGPGTLQNDGTYSSGELGSVTIDFEYYDSALDQTLTDQVNFEVKEFCSYFSVETETFNHQSNCVFGYSETGQIVNQYLPNEQIQLLLMDMNQSLGGSGWIGEEGEWEVQVSGYQYEEMQISFELEEGDVQWFGPSWDENMDPIGSQTITVRREIREIGGEEVALFSGSFSGMVFTRAVEDQRMTGSGEFRGVPDFEHDPAPSDEWLQEYICPAR